MSSRKQLILIRHAKSDWADSSLKDFDRPLNVRGMKDAPFMADWLKEAVGSVDAFYSSPAKRAQQTAKIFIEALVPPTSYTVDKLYDADIEDVINVITSIPPTIRRAVLVAHNPGLTQAAEYLTATTLHNIPTSGVVVLDLIVDEWSDAGRGTATVSVIGKPKEIME
ncbi:MAG: histidine phosphatase family protein [Ignavibacteria bacterium]|nr:histidine phosphatase family protein [Ignavibacteria bacterium]